MVYEDVSRRVVVPTAESSIMLPSSPGVVIHR